MGGQNAEIGLLASVLLHPSYLDNLFFMGRTQEWLLFHTLRLILHLSSLSFAISWKKSNLHSLCRIFFLGSAPLLQYQVQWAPTQLNPNAMSLRPLLLCRCWVSSVPLGLLHMHRLQRKVHQSLLLSCQHLLVRSPLAGVTGDPSLYSSPIQGSPISGRVGNMLTVLPGIVPSILLLKGRE